MITGPKADDSYLALIISSVRATGAAFRAMDRVSKSLKKSELNGSGHAKKTRNGDAKKSK